MDPMQHWSYDRKKESRISIKYNYFDFLKFFWIFVVNWEFEPFKTFRQPNILKSGTIEVTGIIDVGGKFRKSKSYSSLNVFWKQKTNSTSFKRIISNTKKTYSEVYTLPSISFLPLFRDLS